MAERINPYKIFKGIFIPNGVYEDKKLSALDKLIYGRLCRYAGNKGYCWPKQETLAEELGLTKKTINLSLHQLKNEGYIEIENPTGKDKLMHKSNKYYFIEHPQLIGKGTLREGKKYPSEVNKNVNSGINKNVNSNRIESYRKEEHSKECHIDSSNRDRKQDNPLLKKEYPCPKNIKPFIDMWLSFDLRKFRDRTNATYKQSIETLKLATKGSLFKSEAKYVNYKDIELNLHDFRFALERFKVLVSDLKVAPQDKKAIKSTSLSDFLFNRRTGYSWFVHCIENEPTPLAAKINDKTPEVTDILIQTIKTKTRKEIKPEDRPHFVKAKSQITKIFRSINLRSMPSMKDPRSQFTMFADFIEDCMEWKPYLFGTDLTFNRFGQFLKDRGFICEI